MSPKQSKRVLAKTAAHASMFAALGDETRLSLVVTLSDGQPRSITQLSDDYQLTRQAVTKHLRVLEDVGLVKNMRSGRESIFELNAKPINELKDYLDFVSEQWGDALSRLKDFVED